MDIKTKTCYLGILTAALTFGGEWIKNGDFENGKTTPWKLTKANKNVSLSIVPDSGSPCGGSGALGITLSQERVIDICQDVKIGPGTYKLTAYMDTTRCTKPGGYIMLYFSGSVNGKWQNFGGVATPGTPKTPGVGWKKTSWRKYEKIITVPEGGTIKRIYIVLSGYFTGTAMLDGISLQDYTEEEARKDRERKQQEEKQAAELKTRQASAPQGTLLSRKYRNLFRHTEIPELGFELKNPADREVSLKVRFTTMDYFGRTVLKSEKVFKLPAKGKIIEVLRYPECRLPGFYCTNAEWKSGMISGKVQASFVKIGPVPAKKDPLFAISFYHGVLNDQNIERIELLAAGAVGSEFNWLYWFNAKPEKLAAYKKQLEKLKQRGIESIGGFTMNYGGWNPKIWKRWMPKDKVPQELAEPTIQQLKEVLVPFIEKIVTLYRPYIKTWFLGGEVDCGGQLYPSAVPVYVAMINFSYPAIKKADPDAVVGGPGVGGGRVYPRFPWLKKLLPQIKDSMDGFALDTYTNGQQYGKGYMTLNSEEADLRNMMLELWQLAEKSGMKFIAIAEKGPCIVRTTPLDDACSVSMANIVARDYILLKTVPQMRHWLYFRMDNWSSKSQIDWGMWEKENPRHAVSAYAATARTMAFAEFVKELPIHRDIPCWIFRKDGIYFAAVWYNGKENLKVKLADGIPTQAKDVQGNAVDLKDKILNLGEAPVYLYAKDAAALEKLLANAADNVSELAFDVDRQKAGETVLMVRNLSGHQIDLTLKDAEIPGGRKMQFGDRISLAPGEVRTLVKPVGADSVVFHLETGKGRKYTASAKLKPAIVPMVKSFAELEKKAVPLLLNDPTRQVPCYEDLSQHGNYTGLDDLSAVFRLGYDKQYLYLEVRVKDDTHLNDNAPARIFAGDCVQFAIDSNRDAKMKRIRGVKGYSDDDFNFVSALAKGKPYTHCYTASKDTRPAIQGKTYRLKPEITRDEKTKTTLYRVKVALSDLAPLKPEKGRIFGFSLLLFDRDSPLSYHSMEYSKGVSEPTDPSKYPAFQFE